VSRCIFGPKILVRSKGTVTIRYSRTLTQVVLELVTCNLFAVWYLYFYSSMVSGSLNVCVICVLK